MAKNLLKKISAFALAAVSAAALGFGAAGCAKKSTASFEEPEDAVIARLTPPDDGSLPTAHTCAENMGYIASVFDRQTQYHSYSYGVTVASINTQTTRTFKDYKDGVLLTTDLTYSSMVKGGTQTCTLINDDGEYEIYFRTSGEPDANTLPTQAEWSREAPLIFTERSYHFTYGLPPTELFNYIVNENTIIDSRAAVDNGDGTYTQSFVLDPKASTYYYQFGMKTRGGLSGYPEFKAISFSVTFDANWKVLSYYMHEVADANKGIVVESVSDFTVDFWYGEDRFDAEHFGYYENYFKNYRGNTDLAPGGSVGDKFVVDVTSVLSNGFASILNGGDQFEVSADLGSNHYEGYIYLSLDLADPLASLALKLGLGKKLNERDLYVEYGGGELAAYYGSDFALQANLAEVKLITDDFGDVIARFESAIGKIVGDKSDSPAEKVAPDPVPDGEGELEQEEGDVLGELMKSMVLVAGEKQAVLTLTTDDLLGMGIGINARLVFAINGNKITFRGATVNDISVGGDKLDLSLTLRTTTAPEISRNASETSANLADYIADVHSLLGSDLIKVGLTLNGTDDAVKIDGLKNIDAKVDLYADIDNLTVRADADVSYFYNGNRISAKLSVWYGYDPAEGNYGEAVVNLTELNGVPYCISLKCDIKQVADAVSSAFTLAGADFGVATDGIVNVVNGALSADLSKVLTEVYADKAQIKIGVNVDAVMKMLNLDLGIRFGSCSLKYRRGEGLYGGQLSAGLPALGFTLTVEGMPGEIEKPDTENSLDIWYVIEDIQALMNADLLHAQLVLDGSAAGVTLSQLDGVYGLINAYFTTDDVMVSASAEISYTYGNDTLSAGFSVYYGADEVTVGLHHINGVTLNAGVTCNITEITAAVESLLKYAKVTSSPFDGVSGALDLAGVIDKILTADLSKLLPVLGTTSDGMAIGLDLDETLKLFDVETGLNLGAVNLLYSHSGGDVLSVAVPALGLKAGLNASAETIVKPSTDGYLNLTNLVTTVEQAWINVDKIIDGQAVALSIEGDDSYLLLNGLRVQIWGDGEISWKKGGGYVALDLHFSLKEDGNPADVADFKLIYNGNADGDTPLVRVALNEIGLDVYREDIDGVIDAFNSIYERIKPLIGGSSSEKTAKNTYAAKVGADGGATANDRLFGLIFGLLADDGWVNILNNFTLQSDGKSVTLGYLQDNSIKISVEEGGDIGLIYQGKIGKGFSLGGNLTASAVTGSMVKSLSDKIDGECNVSSTKKDGKAKFIRLAYDFLFDGINSISVANILGSDTYAVNFKLDGRDTGVKELEEVYIDVQLYYTNAGSDHGRFAEINLDINVMDVAVNLNVICEYIRNQVYFYMNLKQVMDIALPDLKFMATQDSLYETLKVIFDTVNDTNIIEFVGGMFGLGEADNLPAPAVRSVGTSSPLDDANTVNKLCDVIEKLLNFSFEDVFVATEADDVLYATLHVDSLLKQLGVSGGEKLHDVEFEINRKTHYIKTSGTVPKTDADGNETEVIWIYLSSARVDRKSYEGFAPSSYVSIEFLPDLIKDLVNFATDGDNAIYEKFTFSGKIVADVDIKIVKPRLDVDVRSLTLALDSEGGISFSGVLHFNKLNVNVLLAKIVIPDTTVGITYKNGMLTLAKGITTATPEYKIMTFDYFIDHMLVEKGSVLEWWLDIDGFSGVISLLNNSIVKSLMGGELKVTSGLENTEDVYLYSYKENSTVQDIYMKDFVEAIRVVIGGNAKTNYIADAKYAGRMDAVASKLSLDNQDYYGFSINAAKVTGNVFDELIAAILRTEESGITGLKAYGSIKNEMVKLSVNLNYNEGLTEEYALGGADGMTGAKCSPDFYTEAVNIADKLNVKYDFEYYKKNDNQATDETFGCLTVSEKANYSCGVAYSYPRHSVNLKVIGLDGTEEIILVKQGSTVYMYDNDQPAYTDDSKQFRLLYTLTAGTVGDTSFVMNSEATVYALGVKAVTVKFLKTDGTEYGEGVNSEYYTFVGDGMPMSASGMEAIEGPYYDAACTNKVKATDKVPDGSDRITLYGTFARAVVTIDGVVYEFVKQTHTYTATGRAASGFNEKYVENREILYLQSHIDGYPVTAIGAMAFANTELDTDNGNTGKPMYGIVVPATVTSVGENAFLDNVDMELAVFLADSVAFSGKDGSSKTMPFYGCSVTGGDAKNPEENTALKVYYKNITASGGNWKHFRYVNKVISFNFYIGSNGGSTVNSNWEYAKVTVENATEYDVTDLVDASLTDGLHEGVNNAQAAQSAITEAINTESAAYGYIDKYAVTVTKSIDAYGYAVYTVSVTPGEIKYLVTVNQNANSVIKVEGESVVSYGGKLYAGGEITITCTDIKYGCEFTHFIINGAAYGENPTRIAVTGVTEISANLKANLYSINLVSAIACDYEGVALSAGANSLELVEAGGKITLSAPTAEGYVFLGWAKEAGASLQFTGAQIAPENGATYYAIWGHSKVGAAFTTSVATSGSALPAVSGGVNKWHDDNWNEVTKIFKENTVVYTRQEYTVSYSISGSVPVTIKDSLYGTSKFGYSISNSFTALEGQTITAYNSSKTALILVDGVEKVKISVTSYNVKSASYTYENISENISISFKY